MDLSYLEMWKSSVVPFVRFTSPNAFAGGRMENEVSSPVNVRLIPCSHSSLTNSRTAVWSHLSNFRPDFMLIQFTNAVSMRKAPQTFPAQESANHHRTAKPGVKHYRPLSQLP